MKKILFTAILLIGTLTAFAQSARRHDYNPTTRGEFNVMDYGAVGDAVTDDSQKIQATIDAAISAGGGVVYLPNKTYLIGSHLVIGTASNIKLLGEIGTTLLTTGATGTGEYITLLLSGVLSNIEISNIKFESTTSYASELSGQALIYSSDGTLVADGININNCEFTAPDIGLDGVYFGLLQTESMTNFTAEHNKFYNIGCIGLELYHDAYANAADSSTFKKIKIRKNEFTNIGSMGVYNVCVSLAGNSVDLSDNYVYQSNNNAPYQAFEVGHSYYVTMDNNTIIGSKTANTGFAVQSFQSYYVTMSNNNIFMPGLLTDGKGVVFNECEYLNIVGNTMNMGGMFSLQECDYGVFQNNLLISNSGVGLWLWDGTNNFIVSGNRIIMTLSSGVSGGVDLHGNTGATANNIVENNYVTSGQAGKEYAQEYINTSANIVSAGGASGGVRTLKFTIGTPSDTRVDYTFTSVANADEQVLTLTGAIPARCRVFAMEMVCIETVTASGAVDITFEAGTTSSGNQYIEALSIDDANEVRGIIDATKPAAIAMNYSSASNLYITGDPDVNWDTITAGKWDIYVTVTDYRYK
jgi:hypothetical protein